MSVDHVREHIHESPDFKFKVTGMDCADCALTIEKSVKKLAGVEEAHVSFTTTWLKGRGHIDEHAIIERIEALGYGVDDNDQKSSTSETQTQKKHGVLGFTQFLISERVTARALILGLILLATLPLTFVEKSQFVTWAIKGFHLFTIVVAGLPIFKKGFRSLVYARRITIDLLMGIASIGAFLIGETGEAATVIILFSIGEALEAYSAERSRDSLKALLALAPDKATVLRLHHAHDDHDLDHFHEMVVPVEEVKVGEIVLVRPAERIPVDGTIKSGESSINQATITGESIPVFASEGASVFAGTINGEGGLEVITTSLAIDSTVSKIAQMVEEAQEQRSPSERFIDQFAQWYTPAVVILAILLAVIPTVFFGQPLFDQPDGTHGWLYRALALLIVACPCALVISTPVTVVSALTRLARQGILVKGGVFLDALSKISVFAFDKTGTLTEGRPIVTESRSLHCPPNEDRCSGCDDMLGMAAAVERMSEHPLGLAIVQEANKRNLLDRHAHAKDVQALSGRGVRGKLNGNTITVGSHAFFHEEYGEHSVLHPLITSAEEQGQSVMLVAKDDEVIGYVTVADEARETSQRAIRELKQSNRGLQTVMLTGDHSGVAEAVSKHIGVLDKTYAGLLPEDKLNLIHSLLEEHEGVAMVGDGINDTPALAAATVGIAMGGAGTAQAMETADVVLMQDDLSQLPEVVQVSRQSKRIITQNIVFSLALKAIVLLLTLPGIATLWLAVFADVGASLIVTVNGMRLLRTQKH